MWSVFAPFHCEKMIQAIGSNLGWLVLFVTSVYTISVGHINDVQYQTVSSLLITVNGSCEDCVCQHISFGGSVPFVMFNCYANGRTCDLYLNYSLRYTLVANSNSKVFFFERLPPLPVCYGRLLYWKSFSTQRYLMIIRLDATNNLALTAISNTNSESM